MDGTDGTARQGAAAFGVTGRRPHPAVADTPGREPVRVAVTALRDGLAEWINRVAYGGETLVVHRRGRPLALVVPAPPGTGVPARTGAVPVPPPLAGEPAGVEGGEATVPSLPAGAGGSPGEPPGGHPGRERDREDLRAMFRAIAASAGEPPRAWRPVRPGGPRVRLLSAVARDLRALEGAVRTEAERLLDLLGAGSLDDVAPLPGTAGRVFRSPAEPGKVTILWRREEDGAATVLAIRSPGQATGEGSGT